MNSIFKYLKSKLHVLLFILLEIFCVIMIVSFNRYHSSYFFSNTRQLTSKVHELNSEAFNYFGLYQKNQALSNENLELRRKLKSNFIMESRKEVEVNDTIYKQRYKYYPATVVTTSTNRQNNFITLNRGKTSGIKTGMGVICPEGIVGMIIEVSENYCIAASILNTNLFKIGPMITEMNESKGTIFWDGKDPNFLILDNINKYEPIKVGYHIVSSPAKKTFPENVAIGTVATLEKSPTEPFYKIKVKTAVNFGQLTTVNIVVDLENDEIDKLEQQIGTKYQMLNKEE